MIGPVVMLYAIDRAKATLPIQLVLGAATFLGGVGGVLLGGGPGAQWGFALANGLIVPFWFARLWRELRRREADGMGGSDPDDHDADGGEPAIDAEATVRMRAVYLSDLDLAQLPTMVLPRIQPRPVLPYRGPRRPSPRPAVAVPPAAPGWFRSESGMSEEPTVMLHRVEPRRRPR